MQICNLRDLWFCQSWSSFTDKIHSHSLISGGRTVWAMWASGPPTFVTVWAWPTHFWHYFLFFAYHHWSSTFSRTGPPTFKIVPPPLSLMVWDGHVQVGFCTKVTEVHSITLLICSTKFRFLLDFFINIDWCTMLFPLWCNINWASKETYHFFRTTLTKIHCIKNNNIWTQISFNTPLKEYLKNTRFSHVKNERTRLNLERSFFENRRNCSPSELWASSTEAAYSEHSIAIHSISMAGYVNAVPAFVCFELPARGASSFCDFWKSTSCNFIAFISSMIKVIFYFLRCAC